MEIDINQIPLEGLTLEEEIAPAQLDLDTDIVKFRGVIQAAADITKITNAVTADLNLTATVVLNCSRCLGEFEIDFKKKLRLNYAVNKSESIIDLGPEIRDQIILDYPIKPLCSPGCKGLCPKCGQNLNEGKCNCVF
jgi:uncharacterized protein